MFAPRHRVAAIALILAATGHLGCATMGERSGPPLVPTRFQTRTGPFVVFTNEPIPADSAVIKQLHALEDEFARTLDANVAKLEPPIEVYLLVDRKTFEHFLTFYYPELPQRRAFFLGQGERRVIYTYVSDKLEIDVRHEATHALLSALFGDLPLWLDEGLAEYFECPGQQGNNPDNLRKITVDLNEDWKPDLARLERVKTIKDMTPRDYHEAWAWVHMALNGSPEEVLAFRDFLVEQSRPRQEAGRSFATVFDARKGGEPVVRFATHLRSIRDENVARASTKPPANPRLSKEPTIRLQEPTLELARVQKPKAKRGFFGRVRDFVLGSPDNTE